MMEHAYAYPFVGGGMAASAAIGPIGTEPDPPYKRPSLSRQLWRGKPMASIWLETDRLGHDLHLGRTSRVLDLRQKLVVDHRGAIYRFEKPVFCSRWSCHAERSEASRLKGERVPREREVSPFGLTMTRVPHAAGAGAQRAFRIASKRAPASSS